MADNSILTRLDGLKLKYEEIGQKLTDPEVIADVKQFIQFNKEYRELEPIIEASERYRTAIANLAEAKDILANDKDEEMREMARGEIAELEPKIETLEEEIKLLLIPKDPQDAKNAIVEIRGGTGGDEAAIFAGDLMRMYTKYIESKGWKYEITSFSEGTAGGYKEVVMKVTGNNVYGTLKYESGVHRVQRVPQTETQGRVHTSAASVAVLPEAEEFDVEISMNDIRKDIFCASGPGGQSVNTTYSAIRLTHIPTGIVVQCQDQKSQLKNFDKAFEELRTRVFNLEYSKYLDEIASKRKTMVSTGDRSAKIRTYNYPQGAHHRPPHQLHDLQPVGLHGRRHPGLHRPSDRSGKRRAPQGERTLTHLRHGPSRRIRRGSLFGRGANSRRARNDLRTDRPAGRHAGICPPRGTCAGSGSRRTSLPPGRKQRRQNRAPLDGATSDARGGRRPLPKERLRRSDPLGLEGGPLKAIFRDRNPFCG